MLMLLCPSGNSRGMSFVRDEGFLPISERQPWKSRHCWLPIIVSYVWKPVCFINRFICKFIFFNFTCKWCHIFFFSVWLTSLSVIFSRFIPVTANGNVSFSFMANIPLHIYNHIFLNQSSVDWHLGCFHVLAFVNSATVNVGIHLSFQIIGFLFYFVFCFLGLHLWPM